MSDELVGRVYQHLFPDHCLAARKEKGNMYVPEIESFVSSIRVL